MVKETFGFTFLPSSEEDQVIIRRWCEANFGEWWSEINVGGRWVMNGPLVFLRHAEDAAMFKLRFKA